MSGRVSSMFSKMGGFTSIRLCIIASVFFLLLSLYEHCHF
uniref:Uncharacterized protein n=1 Tax=Arundo donax TaxID=35708 RepID=A0A0A9B9F3_ARUDO